MLAVRCEAIVRVQGPIVLGDRSAPEPDLSLLRRRECFYAEAHPRAPDVLLAVEVTHSSLAHDRDVKLPLYARHRVPAVWLVDVAGRRLTVHRDLGPAGRSGSSRPARSPRARCRGRPSI